jgi:hypothetical protein
MQCTYKGVGSPAYRPRRVLSGLAGYEVGRDPTRILWLSFIHTLTLYPRRGSRSQIFLRDTLILRKLFSYIVYTWCSQGGLTSGRRPVVRIIILPQHDEKHVVPTPLSVGKGRKKK